MFGSFEDMKRVAVLLIVAVTIVIGYLAWVNYDVWHPPTENTNEEVQDKSTLPKKLLGQWGSFQLVGTPYHASNNVIARSPHVIVNTTDAWFVIPVEVNKLIKGRSPFRQRSTLLLDVHSPSLTGLEMNKPYLFTINGDKDSKGGWQYYLTALDMLPTMVN
jgi:hypothetical protein